MKRASNQNRFAVCLDNAGYPVAPYFAPIALRRSKEGYSVSVPALPGCRSQGESERAAVENIQVAIREYVSVAEDLGRVPRGG